MTTFWKRCAYAFVFVHALVTPALVASAQNLVVNGQPVAGLSIVRGSSYAPADAFGAALGATPFYDATEQAVTFDLAGRLLSVTLGDGRGAVTLDGAAPPNERETAPDEGGVLEGGRFYVPVKRVVAALGGTVTWLPSQQTVMVVLPRAELRGFKMNRQAGYERLVLEFDGLTAFETYFNRTLGTLQLRFERADLPPESGFPALSGDFFTTAVVTETAGYLDLRVEVRPEHRFESYASPRPGGFAVVVDLLPDAVPAADTAVGARPFVVIDPGHGGADEGLTFGSTTEKELLLRFALALQDALSSADVDVSLTRSDDVSVPVGLRSQAGVGARLFLSLHAADLSAGQFNLYYLGDGDLGSVSALRDNAAEAVTAPDTDALRRRILLDLVPDLALGESYARDLGRDLSNNLGGNGFGGNIGGQLDGSARAATPAPLAVLSGAAGRGVLLELSPDDLADDALVAPLAAALVKVLAPGDAD